MLLLCVDIRVDTIIAIKQQKEGYINHYKVSNEHNLKLNVDQYFKGIASIDT
jgi:hypothetical protein